MANPQAANTAETTGLPVSRPLVSGSKVGSVFPVMSMTFAAGVDTTVPIRLGRTPSGIIPLRAPAGGGQLTDGSLNGTDWTPSSIVLQATIAGNYSFMVI